MAARHALIGGGTGFIGSRLSKFLQNDGYSVTVVSRMPGLKRITWHELEAKGVPKGITAVVNVAGQNVLDPTRRWTPGFKQNVWNSRINTTLAMVRAVSKSDDVKTFVNLSGVSLYKPSDAVYTEIDSGEEYDFMSKLCLAWEHAASLPQNINCRLVKIRSGVVLGREGGMINSLYLPFWLGLGGPMGAGKQPLPWIHVTDLCRLIHYCMENGSINGTLNAVAPQIVTNEEFSKTFASCLRRPSMFSVPDFVVNAIFGKERSALLLEGPKIQPKRTLETGFTFLYPNLKSACDEVCTKSS